MCFNILCTQFYNLYKTSYDVETKSYYQNIRSFCLNGCYGLRFKMICKLIVFNVIKNKKMT